MQAAMKTIALFKDFGKDHVYALSEIAEIARLNPDFIFLSIHQAIDLGQQISLDEGGFDNKDIADKGRALLIACKKALPFKLSYALPVLLKSSNGQSTKLTFLFCMPADQIENTDVLYQQGYYADFEANPSGNKKLKDSLPVWEKTLEFASLRGRNDIRALILGSSYSGNYFALVEQMERNDVDGSIVVIDYNEIPLDTLKTPHNFHQIWKFMDSCSGLSPVRVRFEAYLRFWFYWRRRHELTNNFKYCLNFNIMFLDFSLKLNQLICKFFIHRQNLL